MDAGDRLDGTSLDDEWKEPSYRRESEKQAGTLVRLGTIEEFTGCRPVVRVVHGEEIAVFHVDGRLYAISNICPHQHAPLLAEGPLDGLVVTCPMHGWRYRIDTGHSEGGSGRVRTYALSCSDDSVFVTLPSRPEDCPWD